MHWPTERQQHLIVALVILILLSQQGHWWPSLPLLSPVLHSLFAAFPTVNLRLSAFISHLTSHGDFFGLHATLYFTLNLLSRKPSSDLVTHTSELFNEFPGIGQQLKNVAEHQNQTGGLWKIHLLEILMPKPHSNLIKSEMWAGEEPVGWEPGVSSFSFFPEEANVKPRSGCSHEKSSELLEH